jgi:serine/threonine protein kinase
MKTGMEIASGLQVAADAGLVHGDIKPENIVFDDHGVPKLLDFGIASASNAKSTEIWGTPYYIAPEKLRRQRVDFRSDIYCLGATLYHALTKHPPFDGDDVRTVLRARLEGPPPPMSTYRADIDPDVEAIVGRMLQSDPADRYPTYGALITDIRAYLRKADPSAAQLEGIFADEPRKKPRTPFFQDIKSQIMLLLVLIAMFPYVAFFYARPMLFPATGSAGKEVANRDQGLGIRDQGSGVRDQGSGIRDQADASLTDDEGTENRDQEDNRQTVKPSNRQTDDEVIDLTVVEPPPAPVAWPPIKVGAIIGGGADGGALVNGQVIPIGYQLPNGAVLRSVEPQSATFEYKGQTKKIFVSKPKKAPPPDKNGNRSKGVKK